MTRVTNSLLTNQLVQNLQRQNRELNTVQKQLATGKRIQLPEDDPIRATNQMMFDSRLKQMIQFRTNINEGQERLKEVDSSLQGITRIFQRFRVLAVQGSNGIYTSFERKEAAATEINQLLGELVAIANKRDATGRYLFSGHKTDTKPFVPIYQTLTQGRQGDAMIGVEYRGNIGELNTEVETHEYIPTSIPGNRAFWATDQVIESNTNAGDYSAAQNMQIKIDGTSINISAGDNVDVIIEKINNSPVKVRASKGGLNNIVLTTTTPHQIWLEDVGTGDVLKNLGLIDAELSEPPNNYADTATVTGYSIFELAIKLRNDLVRGDIIQVGGSDLQHLDSALDNVLKNLALVGARQKRFDELQLRAESDVAYLKEILAKTEGIDIPETVMDLKWLENVRNYALNIGARTIRPTLMDFLR